ncbi:zinc finger RNA-binding protein-like isoform X2 [Tachypleus tridentatus]|uniref:zinc finger RNA-binding protein-like isoform X2 n=1 Tax=Tachypleus tridentatus TaxID=6853 RepID=UPI003FD0E447
MAGNNYYGFTIGGMQYGQGKYQPNEALSPTVGYGIQPRQGSAHPYASADRSCLPKYESYQTAGRRTIVYNYDSRPQTYEKSHTYYPQVPQAKYGTPDTDQLCHHIATFMQHSVDIEAGLGRNRINAENLQRNNSGLGMKQKNQPDNWGNFRKGFGKPQRPKPPPKPQQVLYCDTCKVSCAGPQTYKEHIEGQKHKKREASLKASNVIPHSTRGGAILRCELCDVTCTGCDAYAAHIRGAKHQKVVKLHTRLGKPIPSTEPVTVSTTGGVVDTKAGGNNTVEMETTCEVSKAVASEKVTGPSKMSFAVSDGKADTSKLDEKTDIQLIGQEYIEEIKNDEGKVVTFQCKLCECRFNDPNAKEIHMKGRRHRLRYKRKVDPDLVVDFKQNPRQKKVHEEKLIRQQIREELFRRYEEDRWRGEMRLMEEEERLRRKFEEELKCFDWQRRLHLDIESSLPPPPLLPRSLPAPKRSVTSVDKHVMAKHASIYPKEEELSAVQKTVTTTEKALKMVSDFLSDSDGHKQDVSSQLPNETTEESKDEKEELQPSRVLKGVMRIGVLAKGLILTGDLNVQLVVMCTEKPTRTLLEQVADNLPKQLKVVAPEDSYEVKLCVEEAAITVLAEQNVTVTVTLTSPVMRKSGDEASAENVKDPPDVLDRQKCLDALAALRHAKWFQAKASGLHSCVVVIRILQDLRRRLPSWGQLSSWALELLVEKVLSSSQLPLSSGDALRRVFEAVSGGILLPGGPGLMDPCEKDPVDVVDLNNQDREDITASAQQALRLMVFRQVHKVLGMDPLPLPKFVRGRYNRKRRNNSTGEESKQEGLDRKKTKQKGFQVQSEVAVQEQKEEV